MAERKFRRALMKSNDGTAEYITANFYCTGGEAEIVEDAHWICFVDGETYIKVVTEEVDKP